MENAVDWPHFATVHLMDPPRDRSHRFDGKMFFWNIGTRKDVQTMGGVSEEFTIEAQNWGLGFNFLTYTGMFTTVVSAGLTPIDEDTMEFATGIIGKKDGRSEDETIALLRDDVRLGSLDRDATPRAARGDATRSAGAALVLALALALLPIAGSQASSTGPQPGMTGAPALGELPAEASCISCHLDHALAADDEGTLALDGLPERYEAARRYALAVRLAHAYLWQGPGLGIDCVPWLRERDVAAVCADNTAIEVMPCEDPDLFYPVHLLGIRDMGLPFGEMFDLEALATDCVRDAQWDFFFSAPPLRVTGGIGSPINPVVVK